MFVHIPTVRLVFFWPVLSFCKKEEVLHDVLSPCHSSGVTFNNRLTGIRSFHVKNGTDRDKLNHAICMSLCHSLWKPLCLSDGLTSLSLQPQHIGYAYFKCMCFYLSITTHLILHDWEAKQTWPPLNWLMRFYSADLQRVAEDGVVSWCVFASRGRKNYW